MMPDDAIGAPITPVEHDIVLELWVVLGRSSDAMRNFFCVGIRTFLWNKESEELNYKSGANDSFFVVEVIKFQTILK